MSEDDVQAGGPAMTDEEAWELAKAHWTHETFAALMKSIRDETFRQCAKVCDDMWREYGSHAQSLAAVRGDLHMAAGAGVCADRIRMLADQVSGVEQKR